MQNYDMTTAQIIEVEQRRAEHAEMMQDLVLIVATIEIEAILDQPRGWN